MHIHGSEDELTSTQIATSKTFVYISSFQKKWKQDDNRPLRLLEKGISVQ
jgi:hypothetical protein